MSKLMEKDEELQLCIQRFVSDTQSMINQFSEMFVTEVRRFADVCMEFSIAYRGMQEEREFLLAENQSLKDELDARTSEVEILGKELRETREENEELARRLDTLAIGSDGQIGTVLIDSNGSRNYAVVNSMPAFPRRYSVAASIASYDGGGGSAGPGSASGYRRETSIELTPSPDPQIHHRASLSSNNQLLPPPSGYTSSLYTPSFQRSDDSGLIERKSLSKDDITLYAHLLAQLENNSYSDFEPQLSVTNRTPSFDGIIHKPPIVANGSVGKQACSLTSAVSSSTGTFYDCVGSSNSDMNADNNGPHSQLFNVTDQIKQLFAFTSSMYEKPEMTDPRRTSITPTVVIESESPPNTSTAKCLEEFDALQKCLEEQLELTTTTTNNNNNSNHCDSLESSSFISKTPSPTAVNFNQHFNTYRSNQCNSDSNLQNFEEEEDEEENFLAHLPPVQRINSKKIQKKRPNRRRNENVFKMKPDSFDCVPDEDNECGGLLSQSKWYQIPESSNPILNNHHHQSQPITNHSIPLARIELGKYLLVEVCHFISPSNFYLIINDEKVGTNAFEDFLECFQNFYKSMEGYENGWNVSSDDVEENGEWRAYFSTPPVAQQVCPGSYWACYVDEELDWRRVQVVRQSKQTDNEDLLVRDVDSGYSSTVTMSMLRPLTEEMASMPAFAIRSSLAFIHPRSKDEPETGNANNEEYDNWTLESCLLFEKLTYDQILTAHVMQIQTEQLTDTQVAQVLLWCTTKDDEFEVFINRKFIDFNYATNVSEDDSWIVQFGDVIPMIAESGLVVTEEKQPEQAALLAEVPEVMETATVDIESEGGKEHKKIKIKNKCKKRRGSAAKEQLEPNQLFAGEPRLPVSVDSFVENQSLHHDPRLSNWIVQKHSRHVSLEATDTVSYLFCVTCFLDANKFIGILPFGERQIDSFEMFADNSQLQSANEPLQSPFRSFVLEMTEHYRKHSRELALTEPFIIDEANDKIVAFYDEETHLFLRGHVVDEEQPKRKTSKSVKNLSRKADGPEWKSLSVKSKSTTSTSKWIIYGIDTGKYHLVDWEELYKLVDTFVAPKPFAIACKLYDNPSPEARENLQSLVTNKLLGLKFIDIDFATERFSVSLFTLDFDSGGKCNPHNLIEQFIELM